MGSFARRSRSLKKKFSAHVLSRAALVSCGELRLPPKFTFSLLWLFGDVGDEIPPCSDALLHPFRINHAWKRAEIRWLGIFAVIAVIVLRKQRNDRNAAVVCLELKQQAKTLIKASGTSVPGPLNTALTRGAASKAP